MFFYKECERTQRSKHSFIKNAKERLPNPAQKYLFRAFSYLCEEDASDNRLLLWWMLPSLRNPVPVILLGTKMCFFFLSWFGKDCFYFRRKIAIRITLSRYKFQYFVVVNNQLRTNSDSTEMYLPCSIVVKFTNEINHFYVKSEN